MARSKTGQAISPEFRTPTARKKLRRFIAAAKQRGDLGAWHAAGPSWDTSLGRRT
jgi:hypothetical protein